MISLIFQVKDYIAHQLFPLNINLYNCDLSLIDKFNVSEIILSAWCFCKNSEIIRPLDGDTGITGITGITGDSASEHTGFFFTSPSPVFCSFILNK